MSDSKPLGDWGRMTPVNESGSIHITQTSRNSSEGPGAHVTTQCGGDSYRTYFDKDGNSLGNK